MQYPKEQSQQSLALKDYEHKVVVCGSRNWNDRAFFHEKMLEYLEDFTQPVIFISGAAPTGADALIIQWCKKFRYPCKEYPANWDRDGKVAGFLRNERMAKVATHVLAFHDGNSPGTKHMLKMAEEHHLNQHVYIIKHNNETTHSPKSVRVAGLSV